MGDFKDLLREMDMGNVPYQPQYESHRCTGQGYFIRRQLSSGARVLQFDCGHIQLRQETESLPVGNRV
jgi:hypothetical protein